MPEEPPIYLIVGICAALVVILGIAIVVQKITQKKGTQMPDLPGSSAQDKIAEKGKSGGIESELRPAAEGVARALNLLGYRADFSFESLAEVERFLSDNVHPEGGKKESGELAEDSGYKIFSLGAYVGEVLISATEGKWICDDSDPRAEINVAIQTKSGLEAWPVQRVMKRVGQGEENNVYHYALSLLKHAGVSRPDQQ